MKCPRCGDNTPDYWQTLQVIDRQRNGESRGDAIRGSREVDGTICYRLDWMICQAEDCGQIVVKARRTARRADGSASEDSAVIIPDGIVRSLNQEVVSAEPNMARDYTEASGVLDKSPRLSALLSRRILADLLTKYASLDDYVLDDKIKKFRANPNYPSSLREAVDAIRKLGNWTAHTTESKDDQMVVIEANREEAEWTLGVLDRLFDFFIIGPAKDAAVLKQIADKQGLAGSR